MVYLGIPLTREFLPYSDVPPTMTGGKPPARLTTLPFVPVTTLALSDVMRENGLQK